MLSLLVTVIGGRLAVNGSTYGVQFIPIDAHKLPAHGHCKCGHLWKKKFKIWPHLGLPDELKNKFCKERRNTQPPYLSIFQHLH